MAIRADGLGIRQDQWMSGRGAGSGGGSKRKETGDSRRTHEDVQQTEEPRAIPYVQNVAVEERVELGEEVGELAGRRFGESGV